MLLFYSALILINIVGLLYNIKVGNYGVALINFAALGFSVLGMTSDMQERKK